MWVSLHTWGPNSACELGDQLPLEVTIENLGTDTVEIGESIYIGGVINDSDTFEDEFVVSQRFFPGSSFNHTFARSFDFSTPGGLPDETLYPDAG